MADSQSGVTGDLPDWLPVSDPASGSRVGAAVPDWLDAESPSQRAISSELPDWLPAEARTPAQLSAGPATPPPVMATEPTEAEVPVETPSQVAASPDSDEPEDDTLMLLRSELNKDATPIVSPEEEAPSEPEVDETQFDFAIADDEETPEWLEGLTLPPVVRPTPGAGVTGWLQAMDKDDIEEVFPSSSSAAPPGTVGDEDEPSVDDIPEWLAGLELRSTPLSMPPEDDNVEGFLDEFEQPTETPDWLQALTRDEPGGSGTPAPKKVTGGLTELPDFLTDFSKATPAAEETDEAAVDEDAVAADVETATEEPEPTAAPAGGDDTDVPDWLSDIAGDDDAPVEVKLEMPAPTSAAGTDADVPDWLADIETPEPTDEGKTDEAASEPVTAAGGDDAPDWLDDLAAPAAAPPMAEVEAALDSGGLDWLEGLDMGEAIADLPGTDAGGEDLLGLTEEVSAIDLDAPVGVKVDEDAEVVDAGDLPEWMRGLRDEEGAEARPTAEVEVEPDLADQIGDLRFDAILSDVDETPAAEPEKVGALKELVGVIQPEVVFEGEMLRVEGVHDEVIVTKDQQKKIDVLEDLLFGEQTGVEVTDSGGGLPLIRWLVAALLLAAALLPAVMGFRLLPAPSSAPGEVLTAHDVVSRLPSEPDVLIVFEYEPNAAGELEPIAVALLQHLSEREGTTIYAASTRTTGPAMAQSAFESVEGLDGWLNLGYIAGGPNGISGLANGTIGDVPSPLDFDYLGAPTGVEVGSLREADLDLIIVLASRFEYLQPWLEQVEPVVNAPMIAGVSASTAPMAHPYRQSEQLVAVLNSVNDAAVYQVESGQTLDESVSVIWNAQALGGLVAVAVIIVGGVIHGLLARRSTEESES